MINFDFCKKYIIKRGLVFLTFFCLGQINAQDFQQISHYHFAPEMYNPSFSGRSNQTEIASVARVQWTGIEGAPTTGWLVGSMPLTQYNSGVGLNALYDDIGQFRTVKIAGQYSYKIRMGLNHISFGLAPTLWSKSLNSSWKSLDDASLDPSLSQNTNSGVMFDVDAGLSYNAPQGYVGLAMINLIGSGVDAVKFTSNRTMVLNAGYNLNQNWVRNITLHPALLVKLDLQNASSMVVDLSMFALYNEVFYFGLGVRTNDALVGYLGYQLYNTSGVLRIGYSYDYTISPLNSFNFGTHEVGIKYTLVKSVYQNASGYKNVRFL